MRMDLSLLCFAIALSTNVTMAQTNTFPASGNVGIGTTAPSNELSVVGSGNVTPDITSGSATSAIMYNTGHSGWDSWQVGAGVYGVTGFNFVDTTAGASRLTINNSGNVGIGTTSPAQTLEVNGNAQVDGALQLGTSGVQITSTGIVFPNGGGTQSAAWTGVICGGDFAESVDVTGERTKYGPGDVLVIDPGSPGKFLKSAEPYSTLVAGIYSTKPGSVGRRQATPKSPDEVPMAMVGIVPTKVSAENGSIQPGDLLVTSSVLGVAMKGTDRGRMLGSVIGKALGPLNYGTGVVEVLVTLQ